MPGNLSGSCPATKARYTTLSGADPLKGLENTLARQHCSAGSLANRRVDVGALKDIGKSIVFQPTQKPVSCPVSVVKTSSLDQKKGITARLVKLTSPASANADIPAFAPF